MRAEGLRKTSIVISTYSRPAELKKLLASIDTQTVLPEAVYVVDQSKNDAIGNVVMEFQGVKKGSFQCHHLKVAFQGLTKARNYGLDRVRTELTTFIDDDVTLGSAYLEKVLGFFNEKEAVLVGGIPQFPGVTHKGTPKPGGIWELYRKVFCLGRPGDGWRLLPNFEGLYKLPLLEAERSDYISGSNFTVFTDLAKSVEFDEKLIWYSIGEDIDFPMRVRKLHPDGVWLDPRPPVFHPLPPEKPLSEFLLKVHALHHYYLFSKMWDHNPSFAKIALFYWTRLGILLMPALQHRRAGFIPDWGLLKSSLRVEWDIVKNRKCVARGDFSDCIKLS